MDLIPGLRFQPAKSGDLVTLYCISLGQTNPASPAGRAPAGAAAAVGPVVVRFGNVEVEPLYVGVSPGTVGLYQVNLRIPALPTNEYVVDLRVGQFRTPEDGAYLLVVN